MPTRPLSFWHQLNRGLIVQLVDLGIQCQCVIDQSDSEKAAGQQKQNSSEELAHVHSMDAKDAQAKMQDPSDGLIHFPALMTTARFGRHGWNEKQIDDPAHQKQASRTEPNGTRDRFSEIEAMSTKEAEHPKDVAKHLGVRR